jgi:hypothetical protein
VSAIKTPVTNYLVSLNSLHDLETYQNAKVTNFLLPLVTFCVGYENGFSVSEINSVKANKYVLINRLLEPSDLVNLRKILPQIKCDGYIFEDVGLINVFNDLKIPGTKILFMNHFNCNYASINYWLEYVDSVFVSNELTLKEYQSITKKVHKDVVLSVLGYNQVMYSRRTLINNYNEKFNLPKENKVTITKQNTDLKYHLVENAYGTVALSNNVFNGYPLLKLNHVLFYYLNTSFLKVPDVLNFIKTGKFLDSDDGFLYKPTIYKLKEIKHD